MTEEHPADQTSHHGRRLRRPSSVVAAVGLAVMLLTTAACGSEEPSAPTTTTGTALPPRTTLPQVVTTAPTASTTTTVPAEIPTEVDVCALVGPREVRSVTGEPPGAGSPVPTTDLPGGSRSDESDEVGGAGAEESPDTGQEDVELPTVLLSGCSWPTDQPPTLTLHYLAPTTSDSALEHLQRLIELDSRFARGARAFPLPAADELGPVALVDESGAVIEVAVVNGSALLYLVPSDPPPSGSPEADALVELLLTAARRAPA